MEIKYIFKLVYFMSLEIMSNRTGKNMEKWYFSHKEKKKNTDLKIKAWEIYGLLLLEKIECFYAL